MAWLGRVWRWGGGVGEQEREINPSSGSSRGSQDRGGPRYTSVNVFHGQLELSLETTAAAAAAASGIQARSVGRPWNEKKNRGREAEGQPSSSIRQVPGKTPRHQQGSQMTDLTACALAKIHNT